MQWNLLPIAPDPGDAADLAVRLNSLGSLYFFTKYVLGRDRMGALHRYLCSKLESDPRRYLLEMPRDHLKTTILTEGRTIWRSLPFNERDEAAMRELGYDDVWIAWMKRIHNPSRRTLIVSENLENSEKLGLRWDYHYTHNETFRHTFPELIPKTGDIWNMGTKTHGSSMKGPNGEGTYDFLSVGAALQSRHYTDAIEDDVVGRDAIREPTTMEDTVNYHKLMIGAFDRFSTSTWTVVNNRWAPNDLSGWLRANDKRNLWVKESHSCYGGCCEVHPPDTIIYPEEFTREILEEIRETQGPIYFSHQYLNMPISEDDVVFQKEWLRFYEPTPAPYRSSMLPMSLYREMPGYSTPGAEKRWLRHEVYEGRVLPDVNPSLLVRTMTVDPNHKGKEGRARHAIVVTGLDPERDRIYLLDYWAESRSYEDLVAQIYKMARMWGLTEMWLETVAAQTILKYHLDYRNKLEKRILRVNELKTDHSPNGKRARIESLMPIFQEGRLWVRHDQADFLNEYFAYPGGYTVDILDALGYAPQTWNSIHAASMLEFIKKRRNRMLGRRSIAGY